MTNIVRVVRSVLICQFWILAVVAIGDEREADPQSPIKSYEWAISSAGEPAPALKHSIFPDITETVPGNAATHYLRAVVLGQESPRPKQDQLQREIEWYQRHIDELPIDEVKEWLARRQLVIDEIAKATRCESCDWGIRFQDLRGNDVIQIRLPEFQEMRQLARILRLKALVEISERRFEDAIATLKMLYRLAANIGKAPSVIVSLISTAVTAVSNDVVCELIAADQSPNLYWALRLLPDPMFNSQDVIRLDVDLAFQLFPFLKDAETATHTAEEWQRLLSDSIHELRKMTQSSPRGEASDAVNQLSATVLILRSYPIAKRDLLAHGVTADRIQKMPVGQVVAIYTRNCLRHVADEHLKWSSLPFHEGESRIRELNKELHRTGYLDSSPTSIANRDPLGFNRSLYSGQLGEAYIRQRRMIALLATVEAIRMHAAAEGTFPNTLEEMTQVPAPVDPANLKPFQYRVEDGRAILLAPATRPGDEYSGRRFLLRLRQKP